MANNNNMLQLCRLCLVKDDVNIPIFEDQGDIRQIFLKISSCLPVKVAREDRLPKKICDGCSYKLDMLYEFWNTSANAEKQLLSWLGEAGVPSMAAGGALSAVAQQMKAPPPAEAFVKEETLEPHDATDDDDDKEYLFEQQKLEESASAGPSATVTSNEDEEPPPKRARRTAAVKAAIAMDQESDDDDDSGEPLTKIEDESEDSEGEDHVPAFVDVPSTSADDQAGPSGVGKDGVEAPFLELLLEGGPIILKVVKDDDDENPTNTMNNLIYNSTLMEPNISYLDEIEWKPQTNHQELETCLSEIKIEPRETTPRDTKKTNYRCIICNYILDDPSLFESHLAIHEEEAFVQCMICLSTLKRKKMEEHLTEHKFIGRPVCTKPVERSKAEGKSANTGKVNCTLCPRTFDCSKSWKLHFARKHKKIAKVDEEEKSLLLQHLRNHSVERPFPCSDCSSAFETKEDLTRHQAIHEEQERFTCKECGRKFVHGSSFWYHQKTHEKKPPIF